MASSATCTSSTSAAKLWWRVHASGKYARARMAHAAIRIGWDVLFFGGMPPGDDGSIGGREDGGDELDVFNLERLDLSTSALLGPRLAPTTPSAARARSSSARRAARRSSGAARGGQS